MDDDHRIAVRIVQREGYLIAFEQFENGATLVHLEVLAPWTASLRRACRHDLDVLFEMHGGPLHAITAAPPGGDVNKHRKFCALMGFHFNKTVLCADGQTRPVYTRTE